MENAKILDRLEKFYTRVSGTCKELHTAYADDIEFGLEGKQWDPADERQRKDAKRLTLTVNRLKQFIYQVVNDYKQMEMTSKVLPHDTSEKDKVLAEVRRGIMRSIERKKGGMTAYGNAAKTMVAAGLGGWRIATRNVDPMSFDQEPYFIPIQDMTTVWLDYDACIEPDFSDMTDCAIQEKYSKDVFEQKFGKDAAEFMGGAAYGAINGIWGSKDGPCVTDYWFKEEKDEKLCLIEQGAARMVPGLKKTMYLSDLKVIAEEAGVPVEALMQNGPDGKPIQRETKRCTVTCAKVAARRVIETQEWPIDIIPVVIVQGRRIVNKGKLTIEGLIRQSKDAQRSYNYVKSNKTERIAQAPRNPFFAPVGGVPKGQEGKWAKMNVMMDPYLTFNVFDEKNRPIPPPHRLDPIQADPALVEEERAATDEIKATLGMYDAAIGNRSNETSGVAIRTRDQQADTTNYDFTESMVVGIKYSTKILNKLIPKVIDTPRQVSMVGEDDKEKVIWVNQQNPDGTAYMMDEGEFDVDYEAGPSSATKSDQIREDALGMMQAVPQSALVLGPTFIRNSTMRGADETADAFERFANTQVPGLFPEKDQGAPNPQMVAQMQAQLQQMQAQLQQMMPELQKLQGENQKLQIQNQAIQADKRLEAAKLQLEEKKLGIELIKAETDRLQVVGTLKDKQDNTQIKAGQAAHGAMMEHASHNLQAGQAGHKAHMDEKNFALAGAKASGDHALKKSAQAEKANGGKPGNADGKR